MRPPRIAALLIVGLVTMSCGRRTAMQGVNTEELRRDVAAVQNACDKIAGLPFLPASLGALMDDLRDATDESALYSAGIESAAPAETMTAPELVALQGQVNGMVTDATTVLNLAQQATMIVRDPESAATLNDLIAATLTLLPSVQTAAGLPAAQRAQARPLMTEREALRIAGGARL